MTNAPDLDAAEMAVGDLLAALGVDEGDHTANTPRRVAKAWAEMLRGYREDPADHLGVTFSAPNDAGLVVVHGIRVASTCAHHMLPITGTASVAYRPAPGAKVVGLSKLARVVHGFARRMQVQENITNQVADALMDRLAPTAVYVLVTADHDCMRLRGVGEPSAKTTTVAYRGSVDETDIETVRRGHFA